MKLSSSLKILYPAAFHFKEERVLAAHPLSCHPRRVFGCPESGRKGEKQRETGKEREELKAFRHFINEQKKDLFTVSGQGAFIANP